MVIRIARKLNSTDVIDDLSDLLTLRGVPGHVRSANGPEFIAKAVREWIVAVSAKTAFIDLGNPWENGNCESFNSKLRDELLNGEIFYSLAEAKVIIEAWRRYYNTERPLVARLQTAGSEGHYLACAAARIGSIIDTGDGRKAGHALRLKPDHPMGQANR